MAASNRYSQITPSQFNPLSLEEVMMVPMMKRQQHDTLNAKIESQIAELAKESFGYTWDGKYYVGPKGDRLTRQEMNSKIDSESNQNTTNQNRFGGYMLNGPFLNNRMIKRYK